MNILKSIFALSVSVLLFTSCKEAVDAPKSVVATSTEKPAIPAEKLETASFTIEGMTCAIGCAKTIQKELSELNGVQSAAVDYDKKLATVSFDNSIQTTEKIVKIVEASGDGLTYKVSDVKSSKNKAMLYLQDQEKEKKDNKKKSCSSDEKASKEKKGCCSKKKSSDNESKKTTTM